MIPRFHGCDTAPGFDYNRASFMTIIEGKIRPQNMSPDNVYASVWTDSGCFDLEQRTPTLRPLDLESLR